MPKSNSQQMISGFVTGVAEAPASGGRAHAPMSAAVVPAIELYFQLEVVEEIPDDPFDDPQQIELQPGQQIHLRLTTSDNGSPDQHPFNIRSDLQLCLRQQGFSAVGVRITDPRLRVLRKDLDSLSHDFEITIPNQHPRGVVTFELLFIEDGKNQKPKHAAEITRLVAGNENLIDPTLFQSARVTLNAVPPEHVAILHIEEPSAGRYRLKGWNRRVDNLAIELTKPGEMISLADFVEGKVSPDTVRGTVKSFSRRASQPLMKWFQLLYDRFGQELCLIIADHSNAEIPWEMIEFKPDNHLGAMCIVARWIPVVKHSAADQLSVGAKQHRGGVIAHLDSQGLKHTELERQALTQLKTNFHNTIKEFRQRLKQSLQDIGLVYMACHGFFTYNEEHRIYNEKYRAAIGNEKDRSLQITHVQLEDLQQNDDARPLFFVNACHSARVVRNLQGYFFGLPEVMLARLASGYIGALGQVGMKYAASIGQQILEKARCSDEGINPAEELRRIRAEAVRQLSIDQKEENMLNFVYAFMYVYYGNPLACLRLIETGTDFKEADK